MPQLRSPVRTDDNGGEGVVAPQDLSLRTWMHTTSLAHAMPGNTVRIEDSSGERAVAPQNLSLQVI